MMEKRIEVDERLQTEKQYRYYFPKVSIRNSEKAYEEAEEICNALKSRYNLAIKIGFVEVSQISSELSVYVLFHSQYSETTFGFAVKLQEEFLNKNWILETPYQVYDPIVEPAIVATPPAEKGSLENIIQAVKDFYRENKGLCWLGMGAVAFLFLMILLSKRSED